MKTKYYREETLVKFGLDIIKAMEKKYPNIINQNHNSDDVLIDLPEPYEPQTLNREKVIEIVVEQMEEGAFGAHVIDHFAPKLANAICSLALPEITEEEIEKFLIMYEDSVLMYVDGTYEDAGDEYDGENLIADRKQIAKSIHKKIQG